MLAQATGLASRTTTAILERRGSLPRIETVERLADALGVSPAFLAFGLSLDDEDAPSGTRIDALPPRLQTLRQARGLSNREPERRVDVAGDRVRDTAQGRGHAPPPNVFR